MSYFYLSAENTDYSIYQTKYLLTFKRKKKRNDKSIKEFDTYTS